MKKPENSTTLIVTLALVTMVFVAFWSAGNNQFVMFDDNVYVTSNDMVQRGLTWEGVRWAFTTTHASNWHPLTWLSHMLDVDLFGLNPRGHHLMNVLIHAVNTAILFLLLKAMTGGLWRSALAAALFAVHPLHVESVAWVAERKDVLSTLFWLLTMWAYFRYTAHPVFSRYIPVVACFGLGLMAKPMLVTLPFVLMLLDFWPLQRWKERPAGKTAKPSILPPGGWILLREKLPLLALTAVSCVVTFMVQQKWGAVASMEELSFSSRLSNSLVSYVAYIIKTFWPSNLSVLYPLPLDGTPLWQVVGAVLLLGVVCVLSVLTMRRHPYFLVGWLWYLGTLVPVIGLVQVGNQAIADRYTYVPLIGIFIVFSWGAGAVSARWLKSPVLQAAAALMVLMPLLVATRAQVERWKDSITLFTHALDVTSDNWMAEYNMGTYLDEQGRTSEAVVHYSEALRVNPAMWEAHYNMGNSLVDLGEHEKAVTHLREVVRLRPSFLNARNLLALSLDKLGRFEESMSQYLSALRINPQAIDTQHNMGRSYFLQGDYQKAESILRKVLQEDPDYSDASLTLGMVLAKTGRKAEAVARYQEALRLNPGSAVTYYNLANSQADMGMMHEAVGNYSQALRIDHEFYDARYNLARTLTAMGRVGEGMKQYRAALGTNPDALDALNNLSWLLSTHPDEGVRNARESIELAERACELTGYKSPFFLDTLAAAYAEAGRFGNAVETALKAAALAEAARDEEMRSGILHRLEFYKAGEPFRER